MTRSAVSSGRSSETSWGRSPVRKSTGEPGAPPRRRADVASMAWMSEKRRELDFALQLARPVVVQSRRVALRRREVDGREIASHEGSRRRARWRAERCRER